MLLARLSALLPRASAPSLSPLHLSLGSLRFATKKSGGSTRNGRDSPGQRLGLKVQGGAPVKAGGIIMRQRGFKFKPGYGVDAGRDHTLFALKPGWVKFTTWTPGRVRKSELGGRTGNVKRPKMKVKKFVHVVPNREVLGWSDKRFLEGVGEGEVEEMEVVM